MIGNNIGKLFSVKLRVTAGLAIAAVAAGLIIVYSAAPARREGLVYLALVLGGSAALYSALYAAVALHVTVRRDRQGRSFVLLAALNQPEATKVQALCDRFLGSSSLSPNDIVEEIKKDQSLDHAVKYVLGHFEDISIAIQEDHAEERILFRSLHRLVPLYWEKLGEYVIRQRKETGADVLYCEFETLAKKWDEGHSIRTGKDLPQHRSAKN